MDSPVSADRAGHLAERFAKLFGSPKFLICMSGMLGLWIAWNTMPGLPHFDPYPFIALNLTLSMQAAYAAPLILLAESRQRRREEALEARHTRMLEDISASIDRLEQYFRL